MSNAKLLSATQVVAGSLCAVIVIVAGLLLNVVAKEIDAPQITHNVVQAGSSDQSAWKGFISESRHVNTLRGWKFEASPPAPPRGRQG